MTGFTSPYRQWPSLVPATSKWNVLLLLLLIAIVIGMVLTVHWSVLSAKAMSFDDEEAILRNQLVQHPSMESVKRFFSEVFLSSVVRGYYRPLTLTSLMLDWEMGARPENLRVFHRTSLALHVGSTVLLILLCYQLFHRPWIAAAVGLLFGLHPITVEPIAWVMERKTLLAAFFAFAALNAYVRFAMAGMKKWYAVALVMFLMSLLSKPTSTPLPFIMLLMSYWPLKRFSRRAVAEIIPFLVLSILFAVLACICEQKVNPLTLPAKISPFHLPLRLCWLTVFYPCKILLPIHLTSVYMLPDPLDLTNPMVITAVTGAVLLITAVIFSARRTPAIWVGTLIFYLGLAPTMGFVGYSWVSASDKYVYLPAVGLVLILAWLLDRITAGGNERTRRVRQVVAAVVVLVAAGLLGLGTHRYLQKWQTTEQFMTYMLQLAPKSHNLHCQMGAFRLEQEKYEQAIREYDTALSLKSTNPDALNNRGTAYHALGRYAEAINDFSTAIAFKPSDADFYYNRGMSRAAMGNNIEAVKDYDEAIRLKPDYASAYNNRGVVYEDLGRFELALQDHIKAIELEPDSLYLYNNRAVDYYRLKQYDKAWADVEQCRKRGGIPSPQLIKLLEKATGRSK